MTKRLTCALICVVGCGGSGLAPDAGDVVDVAELADARASCERMVLPADRVRYAVISHPYDSGGGQASRWEVLALSATGALSRPGQTFSMGRSTLGEVVFTPDGEVGMVAQEDGTVGVFTLDESGTSHVVHAGFAGSFYAGSVVMAPSGDFAYVLDSQWRNNGGGIYRVGIACDGTLTDEGLLTAARLPAALLLDVDGAGKAVLIAKDVLSSAMAEAHLLSSVDAPMLLASAEVFPDMDAIVSSATLTGNRQHILVGDYSFATINRVGVMEVGSGSLTPRSVLTPIEDPVDIVASPFNNAAVVVSGFGNAFFVLDYDANNQTTPFALRGEPTYEGARPQLPAVAVMIERGSLLGRVLIAENLGVRQILFGADGSVSDLGLMSTGTGTEQIVGAIGLQP